MGSFTCFGFPQITPKPKVQCRSLMYKHHHNKTGLDARVALRCQYFGTELYGVNVFGAEVRRDSSLVGGLRIAFRPEVKKRVLSRKSSGVCHSWMSSSQIASTVFTLGTAAVLPFYTLMLAAPKAELTKKTMRSSLPYVGLGILYAYLLRLSWTPDTIRLMFSSKYWLPELEGIAKMFSNEMTLASAWIHLLVVDLYAARQVYEDGLENEVETRHSVALCLLFCPIGIISHAVTKQLTNTPETTTHNDTLI
ncbi:hypothetical protein vseg_006566 [Gypsophila vaccaria]